MPEATPITKLYSSGPEYIPVCRYMPTQRTMPTSKHSNSGIVPASFITSRKSCTFSTELSNIIGGQAQLLSAFTLR